MKNRWLVKLIEDKSILKELGSVKIEAVVRDFRCIVCKGSRLLCGKARCPIMVRLYSHIKAKKLVDKLTLTGSSPPDVFVGRIGWPYVYIGPLIPPFHGDTSLLATPEKWSGKSIEEIVDFRSKLVRGKYRVHVKDVEKGKVVEAVKELALSKRSVDAIAEFLKKPSGKIVLDDNVQPFGPSAPIKRVDITYGKSDQRIEKAYYDTDLKAAEAVFLLYKKGVLVSKIQRAFSVGLFGIGKNRRFVPTRWSITAVDSIISKKLMEQAKGFPLINEFRVYEHVALDNRWIVFMLPEYWSYEQMEAWYPRTVWNPSGKDIAIFSDWEGFNGRTTYAETGGCYYSTRLAVCERLVEEKRQASVITFREIHPGYIMPVGVWHTRESIRRALEKKPMKFDKFKDALDYISKKLEVPLSQWIKKSHLLKNLVQQRKLFHFLRSFQPHKYYAYCSKF